MSRQAADDLHLAVGSPVTVHARGRLDLTVRAVYDPPAWTLRRQQLPIGDFLVTTADHRRLT